jgi:hypothetical protein
VLFSPASLVRGNAFAHESGMHQVGHYGTFNKQRCRVCQFAFNLPYWRLCCQYMLFSACSYAKLSSACSYAKLSSACSYAVIISSPVEFSSQRGLARNETCKVMCMLLNSGYV